MQPNQNAQAAMVLLQRRGYAPHQAAGIVGNLMQESSVNPNGPSGDHGTAHGLAQWRGSRWTNMLNFAHQTGGDPSSLGTQIAFLDHELKTQYPSAYRAVMNAKTADEAAGGFGLHYERPRGAQTGIASNIDGYANRVNVARQLVGQSPMAFEMANAIAGQGHGGMGYGPQPAGGNYGPQGDTMVAGGAPVQDGPMGYRHGSGDIADPGDIVIGGDAGGGAAGASVAPGGGEETDLASGGAPAGFDPSAFTQDTSGIQDIQQRLAGKAQRVAAGQDTPIGEISPVGQIFDSKALAGIGRAGAEQQSPRRFG